MTTIEISRIDSISTSNKFAYKDTNSASGSNSLVKYDHKNMLTQAASPCDILKGNLVNFDAQKKNSLLNPTFPPVCVELIDSEEWIKRYGLRTNKLTFENILSMIGFKKHQGAFLFLDFCFLFILKVFFLKII